MTAVGNIPADGAAHDLTVVQVISPDAPAGAARAVQDAARAVMAAGGHSVIVASAGMAGRVRVAGAAYVEWTPPARGLFARRGDDGALAADIAAYHAALIHVHDDGAAAAMTSAGMDQRPRLIATFHDIPATGLRAALTGSALYRADHAIAVSGHVATGISGRHGLSADCVTTIPYGADMDVFAEEVISAHRTIALADATGLSEDSRPVVLIPGPITRDGHGVLVEAVSALSDDTEAVFLLLGDEAPAGAALERQIIAAGLAGRMARAGPLNDMGAALKLSSVVCAVAPTAGARLLIEAQAMGRPVIGPDAGAEADVVEHRASGWHFTPGDAASLTAALAEALSMDESARAHIGMAGRGRVRARFSLPATQAATLGVYETVMGRGFPEKPYR